MEKWNASSHPTMTKVLNRIGKFYATNESMLFYTIAMSSILLLEIILFVWGGLKISGISFDNSSAAWKAWLLILVPGFGSVSGLIGGVYAIRGDTKFLWWTLVQTVALVITDFLSHAWLIGFVFFLQIFIAIARYFQWKSQEKQLHGEKPESMLTLRNIAIIATISLTVLAFGLLLVSDKAIRRGMYYDEATSEWTPTFLIILDIISSVCLVTAIMLFNLKTRWSYAFYMTNKVFIMTIFIAHNNLVMVTQTLLFFTMDFSGLLAWTANPPTRPREKQLKNA